MHVRSVPYSHGALYFIYFIQRKKITIDKKRELAINDVLTLNFYIPAAARMANASQGAAQARSQAANGGGGGSGSAPQQLVITDPSRLVGVQITIPAQPGNPNSQPRALTVQVPAHALQQQVRVFL